MKCCKTSLPGGHIIHLISLRVGTNLYDVPYIARRVNRTWGEVDEESVSLNQNESEVYVQGRKNYAYDISGVNILDYLDLYRKFTYSSQESYRLDHIAFVELGQRKVDHSEYENFKDFYTSDCAEVHGIQHPRR